MRKIFLSLINILSMLVIKLAKTEIISIGLRVEMLKELKKIRTQVKETL